jgi:hypothetical protein
MELKTGIKSWIRRNVLENSWLRIVLEIIAFTLLVSKLIPHNWLDTEWPFLVLITLALVGLLMSNYFLSNKFMLEVNNNVALLKSKDEEHSGKVNELTRLARYADVIPMLNSAFQELHNALRRDFDDKSKYHEPFVVFCRELERVFSHLTGITCHVCIKMTLFPKGQIPNHSQMGKIVDSLEVKTYCRSSSSSSLRKQVDHNTSLSHPINQNTDFEYVIKDKDVCFFCADLAELDEYKNTSFKVKGPGSQIYFPRGTSFEEKVKRWPLDYRATIVAPIRPLVEEEKEEHNILGFLCVDSPCPNVFNNFVDRHIMLGCSDGLYNSFKKLFTPASQPIPTKQNLHRNEKEQQSGE